MASSDVREPSTFVERKRSYRIEYTNEQTVNTVIEINIQKPNSDM